MRFRRKGVLALAAVALATVAAGAVASGIWIAGYGHKSITVAGDQVGCVYSSAGSGHKFRRTIQPGQEVRSSNSDDLVLLPTGDQIYYVSTSLTASS